MDFNLSQRNSVFMPGLTSRGPVYNAFGVLPALSPAVKYGLIGALLYLGMKQKVPLAVLGVAGFGIFKFFPDAVAAGTAITTNLNPTMPVTIDPGDLPTMPGIGRY